MTEGWDEVAAEWDEAATVQAYAEAAFASLQEVAAIAGVPLDGASACDFGCGTGLLTQRLAPHCAAVDAVDTSEAMLSRLQAKIDAGGWSHVRALDALADRDEPYDLVVCSSVLAFVDDHPATVADLARRLRPGGLFVQWDWEVTTADDDHAGLTRSTVADALASADLVGGAVESAFTVEADGESLRPMRAWGIRRG